MRAFITGAGGFLGSHLADLLISKGLEVTGTVHKNHPGYLNSQMKTIKLDITDKAALEKAISETKPDYVFHMAAQAFVMPSWKDPAATFSTNITGALNLFEAIRKSNLDPVIVVASSSAAYGLTSKEELPINEQKLFRPSSPYGVSKAATDHLCDLYARTYNMKILRLRYFNTVGPRKTGSAIADWAQGISKIEAGEKNELGIGSLDGVVDITDGRDSVKATWLLAEKGKPGEAYNICSGTGNKLSEVLQQMVSMSKVPINTFPDASKIRPIDDPVFIGDNSRLRALGWKQEIPFQQTLKDTMDWYRNQSSP